MKGRWYTEAQQVEVSVDGDSVGVFTLRVRGPARRL